MKRVKKFGVILELNKSEERSEKRVVFVHSAVFEREIEVWKKFCKRAKFFVHVRFLIAVFFATFDGYEVWLWLIAALIFSADYYSAPIFFLLRRTFFRFTILPLFQHFAWNLFDFSRLVSLFCHSAKSEFEHQLLTKAIQNEQSQYKKLKSEIETG